MFIKGVPDGDAPVRHRREWVGLTLPFLMRNLDGPEPTDGEELVSGDGVEIDDGFAVRTSDAIDALALAGRLAAANYFEHTVDAPLLIFERSEIKVVSFHVASPEEG